MANILFTVGILVLWLIYGVAGKEYCTLMYWCDGRYYCCDNNTRCCNYLVEGHIAAILKGASITIGVSICLCVIYLRRRGNQPGIIALQNPPASDMNEILQTV